MTDPQHPWMKAWVARMRPVAVEEWPSWVREWREFLEAVAHHFPGTRFEGDDLSEWVAALPPTPEMV